MFLLSPILHYDSCRRTAGILSTRGGARGCASTAPDGYIYADYPGVFDNVASVGIDRRKGLTVEAWIYLTDRPKDDFYFTHPTREGQWPIFAKPGSYHVVLRGRDLSSGIEEKMPEGTTRVEFYLNGSGGSVLGTTPDEYPLNRWLHVAMYVVEKGGRFHRRTFYDGIYQGRGSAGELMEHTGRAVRDWRHPNCHS